MRILFVHSKYMERGGEDSVVDSEMQLLKDNGHIVKALFFNNRKNTKLNFFLLPFNVISYARVRKEIKRFRPDVVHVHNLHFAASYSVIWAIIKSKIPIVRTLHNFRMLCPSGTLFFNNELYFKSLHTSFPWQAVKDKVYRKSMFLTFWLAFSTWIHRKAGTFKKINRYITINEKSRMIFLESNLHIKPEQIITKPNFINPNLATPVHERDNNFLYIGRLSPEKGIEVLLKAFANNGLPLTIIGDGPMRNEVLELQKNNPLIKWLGFQNKEVMDAELQRCTALIVPSVCLEAMPLTIVEGFAAGTPVIVSKLGAMETIVTHNKNGFLFTPNDANSLNQQLQKWLSLTPREKNEFADFAIHTYKNKYTPEKNLFDLLSIYRAAMNKKKAVNTIPIPMFETSIAFK